MRLLTQTFTVLALLTSCFAHADMTDPTAAQTLQNEIAQVGLAKFTSSDYKPGLLKHIVLFHYQDSVTQAQKDEVKRRFLALKDLCRRNGRPYILSIQTGSQNSGEGVDQGLEKGFIVTFKSEGDRNYYVGQPVVTNPAFYEPAHQLFKDFVKPLLRTPLNPDGVLVFDFKIEAIANY